MRSKSRVPSWKKNGAGRSQCLCEERFGENMEEEVLKNYNAERRDWWTFEGNQVWKAEALGEKSVWTKTKTSAKEGAVGH